MLKMDFILSFSACFIPGFSDRPIQQFLEGIGKPTRFLESFNALLRVSLRFGICVCGI